MRISKKLRFYIIFFIVLLGGFYFFIMKDYDFDASPLKVINPAVPAFSFVNQNGDTISQKNTDDKVYVAEYFFTTCKGICPKMNANMRRVYDAYKDRKDFLILSHTCMPEVDSVPLLKAYEQKMINGTLVKNANGEYSISNTTSATNNTNTNWFFVTGSKDSLYKMARVGYIIDNQKPDSTQNVADQFIHTQFFALVDRYRRVRGIYDGLKEDEVQKLLYDIKGVLKEKVDHTRFMSGFSNAPN
ncbi:SCO family protein [Ferruginibacter yonginensis]|uniref:SCO family protein n=1 Tax=Ferruginibacter yonginensis TaxID=1310416 RepID=A0ABV8QU47_9BACT